MISKIQTGMNGETDKDFYCSIGAGYIGCIDCLHEEEGCVNSKCKCFHRKHPTHEQFREEYGKDVSNNMPVWIFRYDIHDWELIKNRRYKEIIAALKRIDNLLGVKTNKIPFLCVVACTPFPKPDKKWRPE